MRFQDVKTCFILRARPTSKLVCCYYLTGHLVCVQSFDKNAQKLAWKEQNFVHSPFTLVSEAHSIQTEHFSNFLCTSGLAQTQIIEREKKKSQTQLAIKISLVIWQARNIFYNNFVTFHNYLLRRWADTDVLKCLRIFAQPKNSICLKQEFSITK